MIWPFKHRQAKQRQLALLAVEASEARSRRYAKLFELEKAEDPFLDMVRKSLDLMAPKDKDE